MRSLFSKDTFKNSFKAYQKPSLILYKQLHRCLFFI